MEAKAITLKKWESKAPLIRNITLIKNLPAPCVDQSLNNHKAIQTL